MGLITSPYREAARLAGFMQGLRAGMKHDRRASPGLLGNFRSRERNGAFGLAGRVDKWVVD
jgi:hypothetical protein